jgi:hypothetical protein
MRGAGKTEKFRRRAPPGGVTPGSLNEPCTPEGEKLTTIERGFIVEWTIEVYRLLREQQFAFVQL